MPATAMLTGEVICQSATDSLPLACSPGPSLTLGPSVMSLLLCLPGLFPNVSPSSFCSMMLCGAAESLPALGVAVREAVLQVAKQRSVIVLSWVHPS